LHRYGIDTMKISQRRKTSKPPQRRKRTDTVERAQRALERTSEKPAPRTDDPSRDKATIADGVLEPLEHAD